MRRAAWRRGIGMWLTVIGRQRCENELWRKDRGRDERPENHRRQNRHLEENRDHQRLSSQPARPSNGSGVTIHHAVRETSEVAHGHTSSIQVNRLGINSRLLDPGLDWADAAKGLTWSSRDLFPK